MSPIDWGRPWFGDGVRYVAGIRCDVAIKNEGEVSECVGGYVFSIGAMSDRESCRVRGCCVRRNKNRWFNLVRLDDLSCGGVYVGKNSQEAVPLGCISSMSNWWRRRAVSSRMEIVPKMMLLASTIPAKPRMACVTRQVDWCCEAVAPAEPSTAGGRAFGSWRWARTICNKKSGKKHFYFLLLTILQLSIG
jgi:hypothetical protein